jgi:menaquinone-dependent protoporphyrinogen IX oxidase
MLPRKIVMLVAAALFVATGLAYGQQDAAGKTIMVYYSRTGKTELACKALAQQSGAVLVKVEDLKDRSGAWGFVSGIVDVILDRHTPIEPKELDLSAYESIIIASPIWSWKLSTPIKTFIDTHRFDGKKVAFLTTANIHIMKYEDYTDETGSFVQRFLRDYLRNKNNAAKESVLASGGRFVGHYHVATKERTEMEILTDVLTHAGDIERALSSESLPVLATEISSPTTPGP